MPLSLGGCVCLGRLRFLSRSGVQPCSQETSGQWHLWHSCKVQAKDTLHRERRSGCLLLFCRACRHVVARTDFFFFFFAPFQYALSNSAGRYTRCGTTVCEMHVEQDTVKRLMVPQKTQHQEPTFAPALRPVPLLSTRSKSRAYHHTTRAVRGTRGWWRWTDV
ncbi:hypothetical protein HDK77DRAFT_7375 [Phyllosticta capitalensis]|uniref:Secreted protein n=1 Tax=Phyllosticta capitalensis TaxID=121624 RepID=A0ABR1YYB6_9PEZI